MGDFHQNGWVTTLHNLRHRPIEDIEEKLKILGANIQRELEALIT